MENVKKYGIRKLERAQYVAKPVKRTVTRMLIAREGVRGSESRSESKRVLGLLFVSDVKENIDGWEVEDCGLRRMLYLRACASASSLAIRATYSGV